MVAPSNPELKPEASKLFSRRGIFLLMLLFFLCLGLVALTRWYYAETPIISPLTTETNFSFVDQPIATSSGKSIYGFLPYWNMEQVQLQPELTQLSYFGLSIDEDGSLITKINGTTEPGYRQLQSDEFLELAASLQENDQGLELVLLQLDSEVIKAFLENETAVDQLLVSLDSVLLAYPFTGINLDIEYDGEVTPQLQNSLTTLVATLDQHLERKYPQVQLSMDVYASAAHKKYIWDLPALEPHLDRLIVMAYDFHRRSSPQAGPIAPLFGGDNYWENDINHSLSAFIKIIPKEKILLGVPFYGYQWQTTSRAAQAQTYPQTGSTMSVKRVTELLVQPGLDLEAAWNPDALSPYLSYVEDGETYVVYYENSRSLSYKLDYVNQLDLGGIAIWALGYEDDSRLLWDVISRKL